MPNPGRDLAVSDFIMVKLQKPNRATVKFCFKTGMPLRNLYRAYREHFHLFQHELYISFDGEQIKDDDTALSLELEDGDQLDVCDVQHGDGL